MRKVLSFVLVLTLVLSSFSMAFAATPASAAGLSDIAGNANTDAIQVAYDLGIVTGNPDGTFKPGEAVNRAQFAAMLTRALDIPDSALAGYTATTFKDTAGYGWAVPYLAFCQSKGILLGDGAGNVMPGNTITVNEAMTMALRAIGYTANSSLLVGAWPANYVSIAQNSDMYSDVAKTTTVDKANAAQIIYNLLTVQKVSVNSDGATDYLTTKVDGDDVDANLLNTNLGCKATDNYVITGPDYDATLINLSKYIGSYGTIYTNDDEDIVAFIPDCTALTGSVDGSKFKVGDTKYTIENTVTPYAISNTDSEDAATVCETAAQIDAIASDGTFDDDGEVTLYVDLSGKTIKQIYSIVGWAATTDAKVDASDIEAITEDNEMLTYAFVEDDNGDIDANQFSLEGVAGLDKIAKDNVVYVYTDDADNVRKVAVGTEVVTGNVSETDGDTVTVNGKDYDPATIGGADKALPELDQDVEMYLDAYGEVYSFDATGGSADTFGVVKAYDNTDPIDNPRLKLYTSEAASKTFTFADAEDGDDMTWVGDSAATDLTPAGVLVGYALDNDGYIDTLNTISTSESITVQSNKVLNTTSDGDLSIDSNVVVFTVDSEGSYDVAKIADVDKGVAFTTGSYITNDDGDVAALLLGASQVEGSNDDVYGVFNTVKDVKNADDEAVQKAAGFIDGTAFSKLTGSDNMLVSDDFAYTLYTVTVNADGTIDDAVELTAECGIGANSGYIVTGACISDTNSDRTVLTVTGTGVKYTIADDAVVYKATLDGDDEFDAYEVSKASSIREGYYVWLYDTEGEDADGIADVVIYTSKEPADL